MEGAERRRELMKLLKTSGGPVSGSELAKKLGVSRQVIVQDVALIRVINKKLVATPKGYLLYQVQESCSRIFGVTHKTEQIKDELLTIIEHGGKVRNVAIGHPLYGEIETELIIVTKEDAELFAEKIIEDATMPLKDLTNGRHSHLVEAESEAVLDKIEKALQEKHYLI